MTCLHCGEQVVWDVYGPGPIDPDSLHTVCVWCGAVDSQAETKAECFDSPHDLVTERERVVMLDKSLTANEAVAKLSALGYTRSRFSVYHYRIREGYFDD